MCHSDRLPVFYACVKMMNGEMMLQQHFKISTLGSATLSFSAEQVAKYLKIIFIDFFFSEVTEQKLASPVPITPSAPSVPDTPEINIQTVSFTVRHCVKKNESENDICYYVTVFRGSKSEISKTIHFLFYGSTQFGSRLSHQLTQFHWL